MGLPAIRHVDADGDLLVRDSVSLVFFTKRSLAEYARDASGVFESWLELLPADTLQWAKIGANKEETTEVTKTSLDRCRQLLDLKRVEKTKLTAFSIEGPQQLNPDFRFDIVAPSDITHDDGRGETSLLEMRFPTEFVEVDMDAFVTFALKAASILPFDSGYSSPALNFASEGGLRAAAAIIAPLALRHPGYDVSYNQDTRFVLGQLSRGARWLTFLSDSLVHRLGGELNLQDRLDKTVETIHLGKAVALRASSRLEIGDINRNQRLPSLISVARAIEPVTFFGDADVEDAIFRGDTAKFQRWERRFWD